ncbi:MAG: SRPBCC family protein [Gammaproteobacteria bacterium]|nr:SRPBCC family protein [Gammaproteobacteria bacterium]
MAYCVLVERTIPVPRAKVFATLMDFGGIDKLLPDMIESIRLEGNGIGALRHIKIKDLPGTVVERLEASYDGHVFSYSIVAENPLPFDHYHANVTVEDAENGGSYVAYGSNWVPRGTTVEEVKGMLNGLYNAIIDAIAKRG